MPAALPRVLEEKLDDLAHQVRRLRLVRGVSWLAILALGAAVVAVVADSRYDLPAGGRGLLLGGWAALVAVAVWRLVLRPIRQPIPSSVLAAAIEAKYPSLAERLFTVVDLTEHADAGNGSQALIDVLCKETTQRSKRLNFFRAAPVGSSIRLALLTAVVTVAALAPVLVVTGAGERVRRFLLPWYSPRVLLPYDIQVTSGDMVVKRGEPVALTAFLKRTGDPTVPLPETASVIYKEGEDAEKKLPMASDAAAAFHVTRPGATADFSYCVEAGTLRSEWHTVGVADPVELGDGSKFTITPPAYAKPTFDVVSHPGLHEFEALQHSQVEFDLKLTRPAKEAILEWKPSDPNSTVQADRMQAVLIGDRTAGKSDFFLRGDGTLKLTLVGEKSVRTEISVATRAVVDTPPRFARITGVTDQVRDIRPDDRLPIELTVEDDIRVESVVLEFILNDRELPFFSEPLPLKGIGTTRAEGRYLFQVGKWAKEGDTIRYRVRAADGRLVSTPLLKLTPQEIVFPEKGWGTLKLNASARPLAEQEVNGQRDKLAERLAAIAKEVGDAAQQADRLRREAAGLPNLPIDLSVRLEKAQSTAKDAARLLDDLARETALTPDLRQLATAMQAISDGELRQADDAFRKATNEATAATRDPLLNDATVKLGAASDRLRELLEKNDKLAKDRLDRKTLERLAAEQAALAEEAKKNANDPEKLKEIAAKQAELEKQLKDLVAGNETLQKALDGVAGQNARDLADAARKLTDDQKALDRAAEQNTAAARKQAMDGVNAKQKEVADKAAELARKTQPAAKLADSAPADPDQFGKAGEQLAKQNPVGAMTEQEKAARELDRLADALERAAGARKDTREAVRQFARAEDELRKRLQDMTQDKTAEMLPEEVRKQMAAEQEALRKATEKLSVPPNDAAAQKAKQEAVDALAKARDAAASGKGAEEAMAEAASKLRSLGEKLPTREQRLKATREEIEKIQKEQADLSKDVAEQLKPFEKKAPDAAAQKELAEKLAAAAQKQAELAKKIRQLDTPGLDGRKERGADAADRAAADMKKGLPEDIPASQDAVRQQLERLKKAAEGGKPSDELADELARKQEKLAADAEKGKLPAGQLQEMQELQREIGKQLSNITDPGGAERLRRAKDAVAAAEKALQKPDDVDELKKKTKDAARELAGLADELAGAEPDAARAERLAKEQQQRAEAAKKNEGKPTDAEQTAAEIRDLERQLDELGKLRAGQAQEAKRKATEQLQRLRQQPNPERTPGMQKAAADALKNLADEMKANGDRNTGQPRPGEKPDGNEAGGPVPSKEDANAARELAKQQREVRDQTAKAAEQSGKGPKPTDAAPLDQLAQEQQKLADDAAKQGGNEAGAAAAQKAADEMKAGNPKEAAKAGKEAAAEFDKQAAAAGNSPAGNEAKKQAEKQKDLADKAEKAAGDAGAAAAKQAERQKDLAEKAGELADKLEKAANDPNADPKKADPQAMKNAADAARDAKAEMDKANRDAAAGRQGEANAARKKAGEKMEQAAGQAQAGAGGKPGEGKPDPNAADAGKAAQKAGEQMKQAGKELGEKAGGKKAGDTMKKAADNLDQAADKLAKAGEDKSKGGKPGDSEKPGNNDGSGSGDPTKADLPKDVAQYLGKPWGELPGDVKSKIIQDLQAKYGEDYARVIKLYFEQIAERK